MAAVRKKVKVILRGSDDVTVWFLLTSSIYFTH